MAVALPKAFTDKMKALLRDEYEAFIATYERPRKYGLRVNGLKLTRDAFLALSPLGGRTEAVPWCAEALYYEESDRPGKHPHYHAGLYYIQEPSAMVPAELLDVRPGDRVLDLCAAPGGKSTQLAAKLRGNGALVANDNARERTKALAKNIELAGVRNAVVLNEEPAALAAVFAGWFDRILVDAPCSGEGMFRKDESMIAEWERHSVAKCSAMQRDILRHAAAMLKPGGRLVYSTCTFSPEENEAQIAALLADCPELEVVPVRPQFGWSPGRPDWAVQAGETGMRGGDADETREAAHYSDARTGPAGETGVRGGDADETRVAAHYSDARTGPAGEIGMRGGDADETREAVHYGDARLASVAGTVRLWPHLTGGEGHYAAVLRKRGGASEAVDGSFGDERNRAGDFPKDAGGRRYAASENMEPQSRPAERADRLKRRKDASAGGYGGGSGDFGLRKGGKGEAGLRGGAAGRSGDRRAGSSYGGKAGGRAQHENAARSAAKGCGGKAAPRRAEGGGEAAADAIAAWRRFAAEQLIGAERWPGEPVAYGSRVYLQPAGLPPLAGLRVVRAGWFVGEAGPHRFVPSQPLAMGLRREEAALTLRLRADEEATLKYLKGETLHIDLARLERTVLAPVAEADGQSPVREDGQSPVKTDGQLPAETNGQSPAQIDGQPPVEADGQSPVDTAAEPSVRARKSPLSGYVLVCADDFPIGWGKWNGEGTLRNELPAGWRWM